jgi:hypothetical protein
VRDDVGLGVVMRRAERVLIAIVLNCGFSFLLMGCEGDSVRPCPNYQVGAIEGYVRGGGVPVQAKLRAIPEGQHDDRYFRTQTDSTGWYRMELPVGTYELLPIPLNIPGVQGDDYSGMDIVEIDAARRRLDLDGGSLTIRVTVPPFLEGRKMPCRLEGPSSDRARDVTVAGSALEYGFPLVHTGSFRAWVGLGRKEIWLPGTPDHGDAEYIDVGSDAPTVHEVDWSAMAELVGSVHGSWESVSANPPHGKRLQRGQCVRGAGDSRTGWRVRPGCLPTSAGAHRGWFLV